MKNFVHEFLDREYTLKEAALTILSMVLLIAVLSTWFPYLNYMVAGMFFCVSFYGAIRSGVKKR